MYSSDWHKIKEQMHDMANVAIPKNGILQQIQQMQNMVNATIPKNSILQQIQQMQDTVNATIPKNSILQQIQQMQDMVNAAMPKNSILQQWQDAVTKTAAISVSNHFQDISTVLSNIPQENISNQELTIEDKNELADDINDIVKDKLNWQQRFTNAIKKWAEKNPIIAFILFNIVFQLILNSINIPTPLKVREAPKASSTITYHITINYSNALKIIDNKPYYYQIQYYDEASNQIKTGWISKRAYKKLQEVSQLEQENQLK